MFKIVLVLLCLKRKNMSFCSSVKKIYVNLLLCLKKRITMSELMQCTRCGEILPRSKLERMKTGTYRRVCNHCKWLYYVKPSRERRILRELDARHKS